MGYPDFPNKFYDYILLDPPWFYQNWSMKKHGSARSWYDCLTLEELCTLPVGDLGKKNSAIFMWITGPKFIEALHIPLFKAWGYRPVTVGWVWNKTNRDGSPYMGLGFYTRQNVEYCILGLRGKMKRQSAKVMQHFSSPRRAHSQKPDGFHRRIEELFGTENEHGEPRDAIELFCRKPPEDAALDWDVWGKQLEAKEAAEEERTRLRQLAEDGDVGAMAQILKPEHNQNWIDSLSPERKKTYE